MTKLDKEFLAACERGDEYLVNYILSYEHDGYLYSYAQQPEFCAKYGKKLFDLIQKREVDYRSHNGSALIAACEHGHKGIVKLLLAHYQKNYNDINEDGVPLQVASENGHYHIVSVLLKNKIDILQYGLEALRRAFDNKHHDIVKLLYEHIAAAYKNSFRKFISKFDKDLTKIISISYNNTIDFLITDDADSNDDELIHYLSGLNLSK